MNLTGSRSLAHQIFRCLCFNVSLLSFSMFQLCFNVKFSIFILNFRFDGNEWNYLMVRCEILAANLMKLKFRRLGVQDFPTLVKIEGKGSDSVVQCLLLLYNFIQRRNSGSAKVSVGNF